MFQEKNNVRSTPASFALTIVSHQSHNAHTANRHLHSKGERNTAHRRTKVSFRRTMIQALELLLWLVISTPQDEATLNSEEIKAVAIAIIDLHLSEGISK